MSSIKEIIKYAIFIDPLQYTFPLIDSSFVKIPVGFMNKKEISLKTAVVDRKLNFQWFILTCVLHLLRTFPHQEIRRHSVNVRPWTHDISIT